MDTLAEGWQYLSKKDKELLSIYYRQPPNYLEAHLVPFQSIAAYLGVMECGLEGLKGSWYITRKKLIAMWCNDYVTLEELKGK